VAAAAVMARSGRSTALWLAVLALALAAVAWQAVRPAGPAAIDEDNVAAAPLIAASEASWTAVELLGPEGLQRFERDAANRWLKHADVAGEVADHQHRADAASAERIGAAFGTFSRTGIERSLVVDPGALAAYGLERPLLIVLIRGAEGRPVLTLEVGNVAPDGLSRYARLPRDGSVMTIPGYQIDGLLALVKAAPAASAPAR
jgi:hypothetical protein